MEDYFSTIDSPEKAYWLGFIYADGCVTRQVKTGLSFRLTLRLAVQDEDQIDRFCAAVGADPARKVHVPTTTSAQDQVAIVLGNQRFVTTLVSQGVTERKTRTIRFPDLSMALSLAFLLGYFDGDGNAETATITSGSPAFLEDVRERFSLPYPVRGAVLRSYARVSLGRPLMRRLYAAYPASMPRKRVEMSKRIAMRSA